jgi:uncharacterized protein (DUF849 family)
MNPPVIIELAVNGMTPKERNRHVPRTPAEIVEVALEGIELGASIVHNHNDEHLFTDDGVHAAAPYVEAWTEILRHHPEVILYPTMASGAPDIPIERRWAHVEELVVRGLTGMSLVDPGSVNIGLTSDGTVTEPWTAGPYANSYADTSYMFARAVALETSPSISIFEPGWLRTTLNWHRNGLMPPKAMVKLYFGGDQLEFGLPPTEAGLEAYLQMLEPTGLPWSVAVLGGDVVESGLAELAIRRGGHVRVGLEDHSGPNAPTNAELMSAVVALIKRLGRKPATPTEAKEILGIAPALTAG